MVERRLSSGPATTLLILALLGTAAAWAQPPGVPGPPAAERAKAIVPTAPVKPPGAESSTERSGFHDLICKPNGTEDGFDCADESTPAKIVPIPSSVGPRPQDVAVSG